MLVSDGLIATDELANHSVTISTKTATGTLGTGGNSEYFYKAQTAGVFSNGTSNGKGFGQENGLTDRVGYLNFSYSHNHTLSINTTGKGQKHENRQPYQSVNRWHRNA